MQLLGLEWDSQLPHLGAQGVRVHPEKLARPAGAVDLAACHTQYALYVAFVDCVEVERVGVWLSSGCGFE